MSEKQQQSTSFGSDSFSPAKTIELLQETVERFEKLITQLKTEQIDYQLPKRSYINLITTLENIFNSIEEASGSPATNTSEIFNFYEDYLSGELTKLETIELLQKTVDLFQQMIGKITSKSLDYQLPKSFFETLVNTREKIAHPFEATPKTPVKTSSETKVSQGYSGTKFTGELEISNKINWPWLAVVAVILVVVISWAALVGNQKSVREKMALETPAAKLELTAEQKAITAIEKQIKKIATTYDREAIAIIKPNFIADTLILELTEKWQKLERNEKEKITNKWLENSRELEFKKLEIINKKDVLVARSPVIGKNIVILQL